MPNIRPEDITFEHAYDGFMMLYKGKAIGGEGSMSSPRTKKSILMYRHRAEEVKSNILAGRHIAPLMLERINIINAGGL